MSKKDARMEGEHYREGENVSIGRKICDVARLIALEI
jgi:hypothetical protein